MPPQFVCAPVAPIRYAPDDVFAMGALPPWPKLRVSLARITLELTLNPARLWGRVRSAASQRTNRAKPRRSDAIPACELQRPLPDGKLEKITCAQNDAGSGDFAGREIGTWCRELRIRSFRRR
jgi:hypothetical protein